MFNASVLHPKEMYTRNRTKFQETVCDVFTNVMTVLGGCTDFTAVQFQGDFCS